MTNATWWRFVMVMPLLLLCGACADFARVGALRDSGLCQKWTDCRDILNTARERLNVFKNASTPAQLADRISQHAILGNRQAVREDLERIVERSYEPTWGMWEQIRRATNGQGWKEEAAYASAWSEYQDKEYSLAAEGFEELLRNGFGPPGAYLGHGLALCGSGKCNEGASSINQAIQRNPLALRFHLARANLNSKVDLSSINSIPATEVNFDWAIIERVRPANAEEYFQRGRIFFLGKRYELAVNDYSEAIHDGGKGAKESVPARARAYVVLGRYQEAVADLTQATKFYPTDVDSFFLRGLLYFGAGNVLASVSDFQRVLELQPAEYAKPVLERCYQLASAEPGNPDVYYVSGVALTALKEDQRAIGAYSRALELRGNHLPALLARAEIHHRLQRYPEALADYDQLLRLDPKNSPAHFGEGLIYSHLYRNSRGTNERYFQVALAHLDNANSDKGKQAYLKALLYASTGTMDGLDSAIYLSQQAINADPNPEYRSAKNRFLELRSEKQQERWFAAIAGLAGLVVLGTVLNPSTDSTDVNSAKKFLDDQREQMERNRERRIIEHGLGMRLGDLGFH